MKLSDAPTEALGAGIIWRFVSVLIACSGYCGALLVKVAADFFEPSQTPRRMAQPRLHSRFASRFLMTMLSCPLELSTPYDPFHLPAPLARLRDTGFFLPVHRGVPVTGRGLHSRSPHLLC